MAKKIGLTDEFEDKVYFGSNMTVIRKEDCTIYKMKNETGEGSMTRYNVFPGVDILYNDFHMGNCVSEFETKVAMFSIDHCREGRIEWEFQKDKVLYVQGGDLQINGKNHHAAGFEFPTNHYHGITVALYIDEASRSLPAALDGFSVDPRVLHNKFCSDNCAFIFRGGDTIQHIFSELYNIPESIRTSYFKVKVLELLLFLSVETIPEGQKDRPYFSKKQVSIIKSIMQYMVENLDRHFTLNELSKRFEIPLTPMKLCFNGVYGTSIYAYMRSYRMNQAAAMLRGTDDSVTTIAGKVGYENASKFASAFGDIIGMSPMQYRKNLV